MKPKVKTQSAATMVALAVLGLAVGCTSQVDVKDPDPALKIPAMKRAADKRDMGQLAELVNDLGSEDAAIRFYAINSLERLTGVRNGYEYYADDASRAKAIARWREWLAGQAARETK
jgi:hypothetical protein